MYSISTSHITQGVHLHAQQWRSPASKVHKALSIYKLYNFPAFLLLKDITYDTLFGDRRNTPARFFFSEQLPTTPVCLNTFTMTAIAFMFACATAFNRRLSVSCTFLIHGVHLRTHHWRSPACTVYQLHILHKAFIFTHYSGDRQQVKFTKYIRYISSSSRTTVAIASKSCS